MEEEIINKRNDKIWIFNAGNTFTGNPKWLFIYINKYRKDIKAYWFCDSKETVKYIRKLGYKAYTYKSEIGRAIEKKTGVFVVEMVKEHIPVRMEGVKILNLWHGVGCKSIERKINYGFLNEKIAKKYIRYNQTYKNNQMFLVTSPLMEKHFKEQCGIDDDKVIRGGYPRCMYNNYKEKISTFDHDILKQKGLSKDAKIAVYAPTYRDNGKKDFLGKAIPDMEKLVQKLKEKNMLLILKMHPFLESDHNYIQLKQYYENCPNLLFWDNKKDIYEIFYKIDLGIVDYSSIFYDMLAAGVPNFVRYFFDYEDEDNLRDFVFDVKEMTCGKICNNFEELINVLDDYKEQNDNDKKRIYDLFWSYETEESFENIINSIIEFKVENRELPELHSYDIFDTLIGRKTLAPEGIFYYVKEKMQMSKIEFPLYLINNYPNARMEAERNVREFYKKSTELRKSDKIEITFKEIFDRMAEIYSLNEEQIQALMDWELEAEYENSIPIQNKIDELKTYIEEGQKVILISDMYLPQEFIKKLLLKADTILAELPLFLSSEYGVQKTTNKLFLKAFEELEYNYSKWVHHGDNPNADGKMPQKLSITTDVKGNIPKLNGYEKNMVSSIKTYDAYLISRMIAEFREEHEDVKDCYAHSYVSLYWVPYISYTIKDALKKGIKCLYFISRDGYHLKRIADKIIEIKQLPIKTKYIYGSRKAWRIPSFIEQIDEEFFGVFGNFSAVDSYEKLLKSLDINEEKFIEIFPELKSYVGLKSISKGDKEKLVSTFKNSKKYEEYLLQRAKEKREIVNKYLLQEIDFNEKFAFVEYWGRGYTQDCLTRLIQNAIQKEIEVPCYYVRSIYPTIGNSVRYNFSTNTASFIFVETLFANLPYESIEGYEYDEDGIIKPIIKERKNDMYLHEALEKYLVQFCEEMYSLNLLNEDKTEKELFDFSLRWCNNTPHDRFIFNSIGDLTDAVELYSNEKRFAPPITLYDAFDSLRGHAFKNKTRSIKMSLARSTPFMRKLYNGKKDAKKVLKKYSPKKIIKKVTSLIKR